MCFELGNIQISKILSNWSKYNFYVRGGVAQWVARLTRDQWIPVSRDFEPHQRPRCFLEQETLL